MWLLIDGNNWFARDFFASPSPVQTFQRRLESLRADLSDASRVAICWDSPSFRRDLYPGYKAGRGEKPAGFDSGLVELREAVAQLPGVWSVAAAGFEADDLLAALAQQAIDEGMRAMIFSSDRDLHQCLVLGQITQITHVKRVTPVRMGYTVTNAEAMWRQFGVHPHQWVDFRAMTGDKSDGIPGAAGIGPQAAAAVLQACGSLDGFAQSPFKANITARQRNTLLAYRDKLPTVRRLLTLCRDAPLPASWLEAAVA